MSIQWHYSCIVLPPPPTFFVFIEFFRTVQPCVNYHRTLYNMVYLKINWKCITLFIVYKQFFFVAHPLLSNSKCTYMNELYVDQLINLLVCHQDSKLLKIHFQMCGMNPCCLLNRHWVGPIEKCLLPMPGSEPWIDQLIT